jgi:voltage-gated sodium channel
MFFVPFILIATFVVLNLFIGVIVDSIQTLRAQREAPAAEAARSEAHLDAQALLAEIRALRAEMRELRGPRPG